MTRLVPAPRGLVGAARRDSDGTHSETDHARDVSSPRPRDPFWDNARFAAIALVVIGHSIEVPDGNDVAYGVYLAIYAVHMPLFAFISGRFSRPGRMTPRDGKALIQQLVLPLVAFQFLWGLMRAWTSGNFEFDILRPYWHLWFLAALVFWRLSLPLLAALRYPVVASVIIACASGYWASVGTIAASSRTLCFLPFFVAGWAWHERGWTHRARIMLARSPAQVAAAVVVISSAIGCVLLADFARAAHLRAWLQAEHNYADLGFHQWWAALVRLAAIAVAFLLIVCVLVLVPRSRTAISAYGERTMTVYLVHLFPIAALTQLGVLNDDIDADWEIVLLVTAAIAWAVLLSSGWLTRIFQPLVHPRASWMFPSEPEVTPHATARRCL